jgi:hypothetical protein
MQLQKNSRTFDTPFGYIYTRTHYLISHKPRKKKQTNQLKEPWFNRPIKHIANGASFL